MGRSNKNTQTNLSKTYLENRVKEQEQELEQLREELKKAKIKHDRPVNLSQLVESINGLLFVVSFITGRLMHFNPKISSFLNKKETDLKKANIINLFPKHQEDHVLNSLNQAGIHNFLNDDFIINTPQGEKPIHVNAHTSTISGKMYILGTAKPIDYGVFFSPHEKSINYIFRNIFEAIPIQTIVIDASRFNVLFANSRAQEFFGKLTENQYCWDLFYDERQNKCDYCLSNNNRHCLLRGNEEFEYFHQNKQKWLLISQKDIEWINNRKAILLTAKDITNFKNAQTEAELHVNKIIRQNKRLIQVRDIAIDYKQKIEKVHRLSLMGSYTVFLKENYWVGSSNFYRIFGLPEKNKYSIEEFQALVHPDDFDSVMEEFASCQKNKKPFNFEYRCINKRTQEVINIASHSSFEYDSNGEAIKVVGIKQDITSQKTLETDLINARMKAEESDRLKSAFLANVSHEIRTPLNGILGFSSLLGSPSITPKKQKQYVDIIHENSQQLLSIVSDVLEIARIESGQIVTKRQEFDFATVIQEIVMEQSELFKQRGLELKIDSPTTEIMVNTDETKVRRIIQRLLSNAFKFTHKGSVTVSFEKQRASLLIAINDTGIGIPNDLHEKIFESFRQKELAFNRTYGGTGLGLSIARGLANTIGGKLWVESETGFGSTFYLTIPLHDKTHKHKNRYTSLKGVFVMIVEDDHTDAFMLRQNLIGEGARVIVAEHGISGLKQFYRYPEIDIIITDIQMPIMDGFEMAERIRKIDSEVTIIGQSAHFDTGEEQRRILLGPFDDYIRKPYAHNTLLSTIQQFLVK